MTRSRFAAFEGRGSAAFLLARFEALSERPQSATAAGIAGMSEGIFSNMPAVARMPVALPLALPISRSVDSGLGCPVTR
jgi:hypothetical protein